MDLSGPRVLAAGAITSARSTAGGAAAVAAERAAAHARALPGALDERYARHTAATVSAQLPWAVAVFLATYGAVALFEIGMHPDRLGMYVAIYLTGVLWCALAIAITRAPGVSPRRCMAATMLLGGGLIVNTTLYHIVVRGEAEVLALGNLYLMIGFLAAFPWGGWPQLAIALAACAGLAVGMSIDVQASVSGGILLSGMASLGGLSVASAVLTDRYRYSLFLAQEQLQAAKEAAERASQARRDFVASVSHDLRTPVNIIFGMADMALDVAVTAEQRELVETIRRSAGQLHALLNDLVDFSKIDAGVVDLALRRFAVQPWLDTVLEGPTRAAATKNVRLEAAIDAAVPESIVSDPDRLRQVLGNLVGNAVKFTAAGAVAVRVRVTDSPGRPRALRCEVRDTGIGIAPDECARLFEPFAQAAETSRSYGGSGLGLAICKRLAEQMGGTIGMDSALGRGSTFWFWVPFS
jgi:signal transduction histidine kinase